ncbi:ribosome biogenesis GTP-binding protein YihA/YsxC [Thermotoga sp. KOL6]|uniref:ribosome biogenesis GTP-binding protein YihA/YsxC n=1 Tax=Thermotoga sp. KOL6 TaxID=126741 RepID=UPI000C77A899|nr:ribosome biogenesis GTP-binding protein YihA/YsxC [Thermotoga sp. KOL6]PLV60196.1 GTP-binding protein [Thermotoga sp. KOL6]
MIIKDVKLVKVSKVPGDYPPPLKGEIAFVGRSNVGKSSLLNAIFNKKIAFVSKTPGKTRSINFYLVNSKYYFTDLPGYGYAKVSKRERMLWKKLVEDYFVNRWPLQMVFLLVDGRIPPQESDFMMIEWMRSLNVPFTIVLTKIDKVKKSERKKKLEEHKEAFSRYGGYTVIPTSSVTGEGIDVLLGLISTLLKGN